MAKVQDRIIAVEHIQTDGVVTSTKIFFANGGDMLTVEGNFHFPFMTTLEIKYDVQEGAPAKVKKITLLAG